MFVMVSANDQITQQTTHGGRRRRGADFFPSVTQKKTNFTTTYCHTCKRAGEHNVTFTSSEIEREMGWVRCVCVRKG